MIGQDFDYIQKLINLGVISSPVLDFGVAGGGGGNNCKILIKEAGLSYVGTDMCEGTDVDIIANFEDSVDVQNKFKEKFSTILILNVLEHTFNPIEILDNAFSILKPGGNCVIIAPTVWPIHDFPIDCFRFNPTFYEEYCKRRSLNLLEDYFEYIGFYNVKFNMSGGSYVLPLPSRTKNINYWYSKIVHRFFNTNGRAMSSASHVAVGAVIQKNKQNYYIN